MSKLSRELGIKGGDERMVDSCFERRLGGIGKVI
jgi:hypothetical protein